MSNKVSTAVWEHSQAKGTELLVLLALADEAGDTGECSAYRRSQAWLARKVNVTTAETVRRAVRGLEALGELQTTHAGSGRSPSNYLVILPGLDSYITANRVPTSQGGPPHNPEGTDPTAEGGPNGSLSLAKRDPVPSHSNPPSPVGSGIVVVDGHSVDQLCGHLAARIMQHRDGGLPKVTKAWEKSMRLLMERGPLRIEDAAPVPADRIHKAIDFVFDNLSDPQGKSGFCWADQIRSPQALRDHWVQLLEAARKLTHEQKSRGALVLDRRDREDGVDSGGGLFEGTRLDQDHGGRLAIDTTGMEQ